MTNDIGELGARITMGGAPHAVGGWFFEPTVIADVDEIVRLAREAVDEVATKAAGATASA